MSIVFYIHILSELYDNFSSGCTLHYMKIIGGTIAEQSC